MWRAFIKTRISSPSTDTSKPSKDSYRSFKSHRRVSSVKITKGLSTLGDRVPVPGCWHKMVLCSHFEFPIYDCLHSYSMSPCQALFWNMSLAPRTKQWTTRNLQKLWHTGTWCPLLCPNATVGTWKKGVFTLVPSEYRTRATCPGTKYERCRSCHC